MKIQLLHPPAKDGQQRVLIPEETESSAPERPGQSQRVDPLTCVLLALVTVLMLCALHFWHKDRDVQPELATATPSQIDRMFHIFIIRYSKSYPTESEREFRHNVFLNNVRRMEEERKAQPKVVFDVHPWMDLTREELRKQLLGDKIMPSMEGMTPFERFEERVARTESHSWRSQSTSVKNQGSCGSCWAFAVVASVESAVAIAGKPLLSLSEQELVDCDSRNMGCRGGVRQYAMNFVVQTGLVADNKYPYLAKQDPQCKLTQNETRVYIRDFRILSSNEETVADWVFKTGPVTFGMNVTQGMYSYRSGVFSPSAQDCSLKSEGAHAMTIVGYGVEAGQNYWLVKNSWGDYWGDSGYFKLARGVNSCGMANNIVAPIA